MKYCFQPIGVIHTPFKRKEDTPIQGALSPQIEGRVEVYDEYRAGLLDLEGFSHIILLYVFHEARGYDLQTKPFLDDQDHGVFAMRAPRRPNPIGMTIVKLNSVEENILHVSGVDMLDKTPLLDIKPYVPEFDNREGVKIGWIEGKIKK